MNNKFLRVLKYLIIFICFYIIYFKISQENLFLKKISNINKFDFSTLIINSILIITLYSLFIYRVMCNAANLSISKKNWMNIFFNSQLYDVIPFLGFFYKAACLKKKNFSYKNYLLSYLLIFVGWIFIYCILFSLETFLIFNINLNNHYIYFSTFFLFFAFSIIFFIKFFFFIKNKFNSNFFLIKKLKDIIIFLSININKKNFLIFIKYGFAIHFLEFFLYYFSVGFLKVEISFIYIFIIFVVASIVDFFPITPKNLGISELVSASLLNIIGFDFTTGVLIRVVIRFSNMFAIIILFFINNLFLNEK